MQLPFFAPRLHYHFRRTRVVLAHTYDASGIIWSSESVWLEVVLELRTLDIPRLQMHTYDDV